MRLLRLVQGHAAGVSAAVLAFATLLIHVAGGQNPEPPTQPPQRPALPPVPAPQGIPAPGPMTDQPYAPQAIVPGGIVVTLYPAGSKYLKADKAREPEKYNLSKDV